MFKLLLRENTYLVRLLSREKHRLRLQIYVHPTVEREKERTLLRENSSR